MCVRSDHRSCCTVLLLLSLINEPHFIFSRLLTSHCLKLSFCFSLSLSLRLSLHPASRFLHGRFSLVPTISLHASFGFPAALCTAPRWVLLVSSLPDPSTPPSAVLSPTRPWFPPPSPIAVLTPVRNSSSSSLSSHNSSEAGNVGSLLILADRVVVETPEDFYRMQVSGSLRWPSMREVKYN